MEPKLFTGGLSVDDRGFISFVNDFDFSGIKRFYCVENHEKNFIRAWHGHKKEGKYIYCVQGSAQIGAVILGVSRPQKFFLSSRKPQVLYIPPGYYNGFMTLEENTKLMFFSTSTLKESISDDERVEWNDFGEDFWKRDYR